MVYFELDVSVIIIFLHLDVSGGADPDVGSHLKDDLPGPGPFAALALEQKDGERIVQAAHCPVRFVDNLAQPQHKKIKQNRIRNRDRDPRWTQKLRFFLGNLNLRTLNKKSSCKYIICMTFLDVS